MRKVKISLIILLVAVVSLCNYSFLYAKNVSADSIILPQISNHSFESDGVWQVEKNNVVVNENTLLYPTKNAYDGQRFLQLVDGEYTVKTSDFINIDGQDNYVFGIKYKSQTLTGVCELILETFDNENNLISTITSGQLAPTIVGAWSDAQVYYNAIEGVCKAKITIKINATKESVGLDYAYANKDLITTLKGASISLKEGSTTIRFTGRIDKSFYDGYLANSISVGIVLVPTGLLSTVGEFTINAMGSGSGIVVVVDKWSNQDTADTDGYYEFHCMMGNMHVKEALTVSLSARAFVKIQNGGVEQYIYSTFDLVNNSRSIKDVALNLKADADIYTKFDSVQRTIVDAYANGELPKFR